MLTSRSGLCSLVWFASAGPLNSIRAALAVWPGMACHVPGSCPHDPGWCWGQPSKLLEARVSEVRSLLAGELVLWVEDWCCPHTG